MDWSDLGAQFCLQLGFGVLLALAFVPKAPVGVLFYRVMGTTALVPLAVAALVPVTHGGRSWSEPAVLCTWASMLAWPVYSGPVRGKGWAAALGWALAFCVAALVLTLRRALPVGSGELALASLSALATGAVAGSVGLAMVLGHWYLTVPNLSVKHLGRLNRVTMGSMAASLLLLGLSLLLFQGQLYSERGGSIFGPWGLFNLGTRAVVGLVLPLVFAFMTTGSLKYGNTRSATGILYASTVLVLIGTALSINLQDSYGLPL